MMILASGFYITYLLENNSWLYNHFFRILIQITDYIIMPTHNTFRMKKLINNYLFFKLQVRIVHEHWIFRHQGVGQIEAPEQLGIHIRLFHTQPDAPHPLRPRPLPPSRITRIIMKVVLLVLLLPLFSNLNCLQFLRPRPLS